MKPFFKRRPRINALGASAATAAALLTVTACGGGSGTSGAEGETPSLVIASWGDPFTSATQEHLVAPFVEETGYDVQIVDAPGKFLASLESQKQADNIEWDILDSTSGPDAYIAYDQGLIERMPDDVRDRILKELPESAVTEFGITWSALGYIIACRTEAVEKCPSKTTEFFNSEDFPGSRTSIATSPMVNLSLAEIANGVAVEDLATHEIDLDRAFKTLESIKSEMATFWSSGDQNMQVFETGEADMGISYSGRAYQVDKQGIPMNITWDEGLYNPGFYNVVKGSSNSKEAWEFVEWVATHPEAQAAWGEALGYSVPHPEAFDFVSAEVAETLADFPANRELLGLMNYDWYVENYEEVNTRWQEFLRG
ncbi:extracellular solute-binding protein [Arthrobacter sp. CAU 1506]|uniref:extracellular solute-binding protein n=1 Tax=Arthrobacter sp. CAU 1506 TaxID=2560052 RepID=UPI0010AC38AD|nr:extracellular solute-binding protein [Arthrobacter sp. CAU 1506]TJY66169.1 extracellular solute-binding protein [Arthrobacter sp. CAU 1506]